MNEDVQQFIDALNSMDTILRKHTDNMEEFLRRIFHAHNLKKSAIALISMMTNIIYDWYE